MSLYSLHEDGVETVTIIETNRQQQQTMHKTYFSQYTRKSYN